MSDNRKKPSAGFWITVAPIALLVYPVSWGPVQWIEVKFDDPAWLQTTSDVVYAPLYWAIVLGDRGGGRRARGAVSAVDRPGVLACGSGHAPGDPLLRTLGLPDQELGFIASGFPHASQNLAAASFRWPHEGQDVPRFAPHFRQNLASVSFGWPHFAQSNSEPLPRRPSPAAVAMARTPGCVPSAR
jgi:hypothetical protein